MGWRWLARHVTTPQSWQGVKIHLDSPVGRVDQSAFHLRGWVADPIRVPAPHVSINDRTANVFTYVRSDVAKAFPDCHTTGFSAFIRLSDFPDALSIDLRVSAGENGDLQQRFDLTANAVEQLRRERPLRAAKRDWILPRLRCISCASDIGADGACLSCGRPYVLGDVINCLPDRFVEADLDFNGAVCSHGYDQDVERIVTAVEQHGGKVLDCGAGWRPFVRESVVTTEIFPYPSTDVLAVNEALPFKDGVFDAVLSLHVLEHVPDPFRSAAELQRVLRPGGTLFAVTPMIVPEHGFPHHFFNPTREGLARLFGAPASARVFVPAVGHAINGVRAILDMYQSELPEQQRRKFQSMSVADILSKPVEHWIGEDIATALSESGRLRLAANYCIEFTKPDT